MTPDARLTFRSGLLVFLVFTLGCSKNLGDPLGPLAQKFDRFPEFSIVLQDMDRSGTFTKSYHHLYKVVYGEKKEGDVELEFREQLTPWTEVSRDFYRQKESLLGMVLLSKGEDGQIARDSYPPGYQYIGNPRYGEWKTDSSGNSFWAFYGKFALFSHLLGMASRPIYRWDYDRYTDYRSRRDPYFGPSGSYYGTRGTHTQKTSPTFFQRQQARASSRQSKFSDKVRSRTGTGGTRSRSASRGGK